MVKHTATILAIALLAAATATARRTTRPHLRPMPETPAAADSVPSFRILPGDSVALELRGYDKPLRSSRECFFAINADSIYSVESIYLTITYYDMDERMLHRRAVHIQQEVPAGQTRQLSIPSWDRQHSFYYYRSETPRRASGTPYRVTISTDSLVVAAPGTL